MVFSWVHWYSILNPPQTQKKVNLLEDAGSKHGGEVEGSHAVVFVVALHKCKEVAEVAQEAEVNIWKLLEQVSHIWPWAIFTALYTNRTRV